MEPKNHDLFRIVMAGDSGVGKTNLLMRFTDLAFNFETKTTIGAQFSTKLITIEKKSVECQIWDTAGQERFHSITYTYFRGAVGAVLVYDVCNSKTFNSIEKWLSNLREFAEPNVVVALVGNKSDLVNLREVNREDAQAFALKNGLEYVETSALTGENVNLAFESLAKKIFFLKMEKSKLKAKDERKGSEVTTSHKLVALTKNKKKGCC